MPNSTDPKHPSRITPVFVAVCVIAVVFLIVGSILLAFLAMGGANAFALGFMGLYVLAGAAVTGGVIAALPPPSSACTRSAEGRKRMPSDIEQRRRRQKREAVQGALLFAALRLAAVIVLLWSISLIPELPWLQAVLGILTLIVGVPVLFIWPILKQRFQEIEGGEFDAAAKY